MQATSSAHQHADASSSSSTAAPLTKLNDATVRKLATEQIITDPLGALKELIENSLDAKATEIAIAIQTSVFHQLSVRDNGSGLPREHRRTCCQAYSTTKIGSYEDIGQVSSYGFRGEGLHALCQEGTVQIASQVAGEQVGELLTYGEDGQVSEASEHALGTLRGKQHGTMVIVRDLFARKPVRLEYLKNWAEKQNVWSKVRELVVSYSLINWSVQFTLSYPSRPLFTCPSNSSAREAFRAVFTPRVVNELVDVVPLPSMNIQLHGLMPDPNSKYAERVMITNQRKAINHLYLNARPITAPFIIKLIRTATRRTFGPSFTKAFPVFLLNILMPSDLYDINVTPDKKKVIFLNEPEVARTLETMLLRLYPIPEPVEAPPPPPSSSPAALHLSDDDDDILLLQPAKSTHPTSTASSSSSSSSSSVATSAKPASKFSLSTTSSKPKSGGLVLDDEDDELEFLPAQQRQPPQPQPKPAAEKKRRVVVHTDPEKRTRSVKPPPPSISIAEMTRFYERSQTYEVPPSFSRFRVVAPANPQDPNVLLVSDLSTDKLLFVQTSRLVEALQERTTKALAGLSVVEQLDMLFHFTPSPIHCPHGLPIFAELPKPVSISLSSQQV